MATNADKATADDDDPSGKKLATRQYMNAVQTCLMSLLQSGPATTDQVHHMVERPDGAHPNSFGISVFALVREGLIRQVDVEVSKRRENRGRLVRTWELVDPAQGAAWLSNHPPANHHEALSELVARETAQ